jgi:hypothetical protein
MKSFIHSLLAAIALIISSATTVIAADIVISADQLNAFSSPKSRVPAVGFLNNDMIQVPGFNFTEGPAQAFTSTIPDDLNDWTGVTVILLRMYSPSASGARVAVLIRSAEDTTSPKAFPTNYWWTTIKADWVGWKDIEITVDSLSARKISGAPKKVSQLIFRSTMGPDDDSNAIGIRKSMPHTWGFERITVLK